MDPPSSSLPELPGSSGDSPSTAPLHDIENLVRNHALAGGAAPGDAIGPYRLLSLLGEGGFGEVWLAERREPFVQRVAIKLIKPGMDSRAVLGRFEQERQALAVMDHPHIAKVLDGGVTTAAMGSRPYFVMEHVQGESITTFCDRHTYTVSQRLELFANVCEAVQHAHHKGIIHRDLKPSNILVLLKDDRAIPKVIDFGVAKAMSQSLTARSIFTEQGRLIGTPEYMSPEQAEMGAVDIDTRTDVYSLGVVLYELLAGALPFDPRTLRSAGIEAIRRIIREQDPPKPSTRLTSLDDETGAAIARKRESQRDALGKQLRRELDWIPLKALRKDRVERYRTPSDLADDIRRYLKGEALEAGPEAAGYRVRKYLRRHKGPLAACAAVIVTLSAGLAATLWQAGQARREAASARAAEAEQRRLAELSEAKTAEAEAARKGERAARERIECDAYIAGIEMAVVELDARRFAYVSRRLNACPERLRGWEWRLVNASADQSLVTLLGHTGAVRTVRFSPDGSRVVTASTDGTARVWHSSTGHALLTLRVSARDIVGVAVFSPDGTKIVTTAGKAAQLWDAATGELLTTLKGHRSRLGSAAFSPDGRQVVTTSDDSTVLVFDAAMTGGSRKLVGHTGRVSTAEFAGDSLRVVTASSDSTACVWDTAIGEPAATLRGHTARLNSAVFSADGSRVATSSEDGTARIWDSKSGLQLLVLHEQNAQAIRDARFSSDERLLLTTSTDWNARLWDARAGESLRTLAGHSDRLVRASFSHDDTLVLTASWDATGRIWKTSNGRSAAELRGHAAMLTDAVFSPDSTRVATACTDGSVRIWDAAMDSRAFERTPNGIGHSQRAAFSPDGTRILTSGTSGSTLWRIDTGEALAQTSVAPALAYYSPDGSLIASATLATIVLSDAHTLAPLRKLEGHTAPVTSCAFCADGTRMVSASADNTCLVWATATGQCTVPLEGAGSRAAMSPTGDQIVTALGGEARIQSATTGKTIRELNGNSRSITAIAYNLDGTRIVAGAMDGTARVWDAATGGSLLQLNGHLQPILAVAYSPDGTRIATGSVDECVRLWDASSGTSLIELRGSDLSVVSVAFSPDGTQLLTVSENGRVRLWDSVPYRERFRDLQKRGLRR